MSPEPGQDGHGSSVDERPRPGHQVFAVCDLPAGTHNKTLVATGTPGEIVRAPAYFCTTYSIAFVVHDKSITLHGINRHEFRLQDHDRAHPVPGYPPNDRYPQPRRADARETDR